MQGNRHGTNYFSTILELLYCNVKYGLNKTSSSLEMWFWTNSRNADMETVGTL